ncbi:hypothetical protein PR048_017822 [Dryococelus australis]|uniref:Uncharacterized protein n=1 Tax=Dryococelus australis TaxID=614101 RepID=A0ABQ9HAK1_9NEOP|nr:hypothetical protein PR048_017822 [Dryococelus australis]
MCDPTRIQTQFVEIRSELSVQFSTAREVGKAVCKSGAMAALGAILPETLKALPEDRPQHSARAVPDFRMWESCQTMPLVGGFSLGSPAFPTLSFWRSSTNFNHLHRSQDLAVKCLPNLFTLFTHLTSRVKRGEYGTTSECCIVRHDSNIRKSGSDPAGNLTRFTLVGGEQSNHYTSLTTDVYAQFTYKKHWHASHQGELGSTPGAAQAGERERGTSALGASVAAVTSRGSYREVLSRASNTRRGLEDFAGGSRASPTPHPPPSRPCVGGPVARRAPPRGMRTRGNRNHRFRITEKLEEKGSAPTFRKYSEVKQRADLTRGGDRDASCAHGSDRDSPFTSTAVKNTGQLMLDLVRKHEAYVPLSHYGSEDEDITELEEENLETCTVSSDSPSIYTSLNEILDELAFNIDPSEFVQTEPTNLPVPIEFAELPITTELTNLPVPTGCLGLPVPVEHTNIPVLAGSPGLPVLVEPTNLPVPSQSTDVFVTGEPTSLRGLGGDTHSLFQPTQ